jgi:DNA-binding MurR/RpiR family transcriptional regulator
MIYLTDSRAAPLAAKADILILQKTESPQFFPSMVAVMAAVETLISVIVSRGGDDAMRSIADYSEIRAKGDFYLG